MTDKGETRRFPAAVVRETIRKLAAETGAPFLLG